MLHIHAQPLWHDEATIVGNAQALTALRDLISEALSKGKGDGGFTVSDGDGYQLTVKLRPALFGDPMWDNCRLPYTDPIARPPYEGMEP